MNITVFYAWQSDRPQRITRDLIHEAAKLACARLTDDRTNPWVVTLDSDTQNEPGMCDIPQAILRKIRRADIFLADLTFVTKTEAGKNMPNANVIFELGYAARQLGFGALVAVMNTAFGKPEGQVFDIKRRASIRFRCDADATEATDLCTKAGISNHIQLGVSGIGGSRIIQHWDLPDGKNKGKEALKTGKVEVLTMSPIFLPDVGIENFVSLALERNKDIRIIVQPIWLRADTYEPDMKRPAKVDHNAISIEELRKRHAVHFEKMDAHVRELNKKIGRTVLYIAPAPQAVIALREKIVAGQAPGLKKQSDLFTDATGHGTPPLKALVGYCNFATIYRRSPIGLPVPAILKEAKLGDQEDKLNRLLQELAWEAVVQHPLSGVRLDGR